ncbi:MAG: S24 family peptidase [Bacillota bacterium]|nr:S24 family peptidase [Bacillota bacterium]
MDRSEMLAQNLRRARQARGLTLEQVASNLHIERSTLCRYESGDIANIPPARIEALAKAYGLSPAELMGWQSQRLLPLLGEIACGAPVFAEQNVLAMMPEPPDVRADFCLRANGDSMRGARIYDGDIVYIRACDTVDDGEIAAVLLDDEATLKRVYRERGMLQLLAENPAVKPLIIAEGDHSVRILGKAVAFCSTIV